LKVWRRENQKEAREATIAAQQSITQNRWKGFCIIFNSLITYQVLQHVEEEAIINIVQTNVEKVNRLTIDGTQQSTIMGSWNIDHEYQEPTKELNILEDIVNAFGTIDWVIEEGWPHIPRWQVDEKLVRTLNNDGSRDQPLDKELFGITLSLDLVNKIILSTRQLTTIATMMNVNPLMVVVPINVLRIQLPKYHDNDDLVIHIPQSTKVCVTNGEDTNDHKI
jgi:hypothetical protein